MRPSHFWTLALLLLLGITQPAHACSCATLEPIALAYEKSHSVLVGRVEASDYLHGPFMRFFHEIAEALEAGPAESIWMVTKVRVEVAFKNSQVGTLLEIRHGDDRCCLCGMNLETGDRLLIFAHTFDSNLHTSSCSSRRILPGEPAPKELKLLEELMVERGKSSKQ